MAKKILLIMRKNSMTLLGAAILASGIFYVVNHPEMFTASILSLQEQNFIVEKWRDIAYKTENNYVDIFLSKDIEPLERIEFTIRFDGEEIIIDPENIQWQGTRARWEVDENTLSIQYTPDTNIQKSESIILLPFTWQIQDILLSEAVGNMANGKPKNLSIGSLNQNEIH